MAMTNAERQKGFYQRTREATLKGKQRAFFLLPEEVVTRIKTLAGFYELEQEQVVERAIAMLWEDRYALHPMPVNLRPAKVADDPPAPRYEQMVEQAAPGEILSAIELEKVVADIEARSKPKSRPSNKRKTPPVLIDIIPDQNDLLETNN